MLSHISLTVQDEFSNFGGDRWRHLTSTGLKYNTVFLNVVLLQALEKPARPPGQAGQNGQVSVLVIYFSLHSV